MDVIEGNSEVVIDHDFTLNVCFIGSDLWEVNID